MQLALVNAMGIANEKRLPEEPFFSLLRWISS
jgi:hypothetical protein